MSGTGSGRVQPCEPWRLEAGDVYVWVASLDRSRGTVERLYGWLSHDERARAHRYRFARHRRRYTAGRGLLRLILGRYLGTHPQDVQFSYGPHGKPALSCRFGSELRFNVSHCEELALVGISRRAEVGVDLEAIRPLADADQLAERFFAAREVATLRALPAARRPAGFFNCWTRKEAYVKALGQGLARPLDQFEVSLAPGEPARLLDVAGDPAEASRWTLWAPSPAPGFASAVAVAGRPGRVRCAWWPERADWVLNEVQQRRHGAS